MSKITFFFLLIILLSCEQPTSNQLFVDQRVCFDTISYGNAYSNSFVFSNNTQDTIFIEKITHSCECVQIINKDELRFIPPKGKDSLIFLLTPQNQGYISRGVYIFLRDKQQPVDLIIEGYVK